jgi:hypothetical protein
MAYRKERERGPLNCIPSSASVRDRLNLVLAEAKKLRILPRTARQIERVETRDREGQKDD